MATRDFHGETAAGEAVFRAVSEWMTVDLSARKLVKLPDDFSALAPEGTPRVEIAPSEGKFSDLDAVHGRAPVRVRLSDLDFNDHVNNVHYVAWALESLPADYRRRRATHLDIVFRQEALAGDELESCTEIVEPGLLRHKIVRLSDGALLATAETKWSFA
jgi:acyl-ACP thioesterase